MATVPASQASASGSSTRWPPPGMVPESSLAIPGRQRVVQCLTNASLSNDSGTNSSFAECRIKMGLSTLCQNPLAVSSGKSGEK